MHGLLKIRDAAFRSGDKAVLRVARANLSHAIRKTKLAYLQRINEYFQNTRATVYVARHSGHFGL